MPETKGASQVALAVKKLPASVGVTKDLGLVPGSEDLLEEGMPAHSSILTWRIPWTERPGRLEPIGSQRVGHKVT